MTPPVTPKIVPAPEDMPSGLSKPSPRMLTKSMPADLIIQASSRVVRTMSVSVRPFVSSSGRAASDFLAVQGITATLRIFCGSIFIFSAK